MFYQLAMQMMPENGNPFNQLAVLYTYEGNELRAIEMYFRSLVVKNSFPTALDNIQKLVKKASEKYANSIERDQGPDEQDAFKNSPIESGMKRGSLVVQNSFPPATDNIQKLVRKTSNKYANSIERELVPDEQEEYSPTKTSPIKSGVKKETFELPFSSLLAVLFKVSSPKQKY
jgi:ribosome-associated translation inhibitor RaiA